MEKLNYYAIGEGIINETIDFNMDLYEFVDIKTYSKETILSIAKEFIENHKEETIDYIKWCFSLIDDCNIKTYNTMFDIVYKHTLYENKNYYWNKYTKSFVPKKMLEDIEEDLISDNNCNKLFKYEKDLDGYILVVINNDNFKILNDNEKYMFRNNNGDITYFKDTEALLDHIYKLSDEIFYNERILKRHLNNYELVGKEVLEHEISLIDNNGDLLYWINIDKLSLQTIEDIGKEFIKKNPEYAEKFIKYILGIINECPNICDIVKKIIQESILKFDKKTYYWNNRFSQIMPREILTRLEEYLSINGFTFIHKINNNDEYIEIPLMDNHNAKIYGCSYDNITGQNHEYYLEIFNTKQIVDKYGISTCLKKAITN